MTFILVFCNNKLKCFGNLTTVNQHTSMTHTKPIPMVIIALYLKKDVYFGEVRIPFMLVKCITREV